MMKAWIGLPEDDGGIPVIISGMSQNHSFTYIDTLGRKEEPILSVDEKGKKTSAITDKIQTQEIFHEIDVALVSEICTRAYKLLEQASEVWEMLGFKDLFDYEPWKVGGNNASNDNEEV